MERGEKLEIIRKLNKFIQENYDEIEVFAKKEYKVLFVGKHKYWSMGKWNETNILKCSFLISKCKICTLKNSISQNIP